eukprot:scaffold11044_cov113-Isochrysis_galbana.AAC.1
MAETKLRYMARATPRPPPATYSRFPAPRPDATPQVPPGIRCASRRAVYDALDARNPRQAIKHCNALLAKAPYPLVKALKALALERTGKHVEAAALAREAAESQLADEATLSTLCIVWRAQGRVEEATAAYASALQRRPDSEELAIQLFCCHMRARAYAPAQLLALKLYKGFPGAEAPLYLSWAVTALLLQADALAPLVQGGGPAGTLPPASVAAASEEAKKEVGAEAKRTEGAGQDTEADAEAKKKADAVQRVKLLQLAVAMMGREEVRGEGDLQLRLSALRRLGDVGSALCMIEQHGGLFCTPIERIRARAQLLESDRRWPDAQAAHRDVLIGQAADDWAAWLGFVRAAIQGGGAAALGEVQALMQQVRDAAAGGGGAAGGGAEGGVEEGVGAEVVGAQGLGAAIVGHGGTVAGTGRGMWLAAVELESALLAQAGWTDGGGAEGGGDGDGGAEGGGAGSAACMVRPGAHGPLLDSLSTYFALFAHKPCCAHDALAYLRCLDAPDAAALVARVEATVGPPPAAGSPPPVSEQWLCRFVCACEWRLGAGVAAAAAGGVAAQGQAGGSLGGQAEQGLESAQGVESAQGLESAQGVDAVTAAFGQATVRTAGERVTAAAADHALLLRRRLASSWLDTHATHSDLPPGIDPRERKPADVLPLLAAQLLMAAPMTEWYFTPDRGLCIDRRGGPVPYTEGGGGHGGQVASHGGGLFWGMEQAGGGGGHA